ncbi:glycosyltransferase [Sulfitobacter sp. F26169L]|uniref:glycosyltransferase n=1 Tax=Sulfitobacter sp. F26169L TaxID=2996015 RepID=UPI002260CB57|nr:glycosyltransferase [Sulfitobacter sp. F26169L]MCX7568048.1 glycosyltransferase [Sulfitobacter sp. F26169L]
MDNDNPVKVERDRFDPVWYLRTYDDVRQANIDPWHHYDTMGAAEGRLGVPVQALDLDFMLWRGFDGMVLPMLHDLTRADTARERAAAGWALARWYYDRGEMARARDMIEVFFAQSCSVQIPRNPGPWLLGVQVLLACDDPDRAESILATARAHFDSHADLDLAGMLCDKYRGGTDAQLNTRLGAIYERHDLVPVCLGKGSGARFDRLCATAQARVGEGPVVSVIMPVFNAADVLGHAVEGLLAQSWQNLEILIVDDASDDDSVEVAQRYASRDPRIRVLAQARNGGAYQARNIGLAAATGDFFTVHDADDWSHPDKIKMQVNALIEDTTLSATVTHMVRVSEDLDMTRWRLEDGWVYRNVSSLMMRISLRERLGYWDRARVSADTEYYYRIQAADGAQAIREILEGVPLSFARTTAQSLTQQSGTHLRSQFVGLRRDYIEAAQRWHRRAQDAGSLYMPQNPDVRPFRVPAAIASQDRQPPPTDVDILRGSPLFDPQWYQLANLDVLFADMDPVRHYLDGGARENRDTGPGFSSGAYRLAQKLDEDENPLIHWETQGRAGGGGPLPVFQGEITGKVSVLVFAHSAGKTFFGAERSLLDVVGRMAERGLAPVVVLPTLRNPEYLERLLPITAAVEVMPQLWRFGSRAPHPDTLMVAARLIEKYKPDTVHVNTLVLDAPLVAARAAGCETVVHVRELPAQDAGLCRILGTDPETLHKQLLEQADRFVANSAVVADWLACPERTVIRPNSVNDDLFDLPFRPDGPLTVGLISSNVAKKGIGDFLKVAELALAAGSTMRFALIGPPTQDLHVLQPFASNVEFRGYARTAQHAIAQTDVVVSLSRFAESFGRTVLEAMAAGRPVVCYDRGAPPSIVRSGETGFVVPADDPQQVLEALMTLDAARGQLMQMSRAARVRAQALQALAKQDG